MINWEAVQLANKIFHYRVTSVSVLLVFFFTPVANVEHVKEAVPPVLQQKKHARAVLSILEKVEMTVFVTPQEF